MCGFRTAQASNCVSVCVRCSPMFQSFITLLTEMKQFSGKRSQDAAMPTCRSQFLLPNWNKLLPDCLIEKSKTEVDQASVSEILSRRFYGKNLASLETAIETARAQIILNNKT